MMSEMIGNVRINDEDYPGRDLYSDGAVEDELLEIAMHFPPEEFDRVVSERKSWPVMYHFSSVRGNILSWYPVKNTDKVLEIGSGCGAVTDVLADRAKSVTCVDLSKKRSLVNAYRNREKDNIEIRLGNFQDVEKKLPCDYDLITLIGVFEYGSGYIASDRPYVDFLKIIGKHLAPGGRILIAIENRLGLKYLSGCTEDHTGRFFDGIENYPDTDYVRTFSRPELERIFAEAGFPEYEFRYPYPDYKFALSIYSDERLPKAGELRNNMVNYDRRRLVLFDEAKAFDSMIDAGEFPLFSNSYFVTLGKEECAPAYVKFSNDRGAQHSIRTEIVPDGEFNVRKVPAVPAAEEHVRSIAASYEALSGVFEGTRFEANRCRMEGNAAAFEFVNGRTLEEELTERMKAGHEETLAAFSDFFSELDRTARCPFESSELFREVFGDVQAGGNASSVSDIDLIPANILVLEDRWVVIDYEWTFPCPVPVDYIKWRVIHYFLAGRADSCPVTEQELIHTAGIRREDLLTFSRMEEHFQEWAAKDAEPLWKLYPEVSEGSVSLSELLGGTGSRTGTVTVYFDRGQGFNESDSAKLAVGSDGSVSGNFSLDGVRSVRVDPTEMPVTARIDALLIDGTACARGSVMTNGFTADGVTYVFGCSDPQLIVTSVPEQAKLLTLGLMIRLGAAEFRNAAAVMLAEKDRMLRQAKKETQALQDILEHVMDAVDAIKETKTVRTWRNAREKMNKSDPFASIRPVLTVGQGIHLSLDRRAYEPGGICLLGWVYDEGCEAERLTVIDASGNAIDAEIRRNVREDVSRALNLAPDREVGFCIRIGFDQLTDLPLALRVENRRGILTRPLDIETDPDRRKMHRRSIQSGSIPNDGPAADEYDDWVMDHEEAPREYSYRKPGVFPYEPVISIVIPLYRTPETYLLELLESLTEQTYRKVEICLADGSPDNSVAWLVAKHFGTDARVVYRKLDSNLGISGNTNEALKMATGELVMLCDHDDVVERSACFEIVKAFNSAPEVDIVYSDEDKITAKGHFLYDPNFKPDYSPDLLCSSNYICHLFAFRRALLDRTGVFRSGFDGAQDHDFILRCCEQARAIRHIPKVLYHWRAHPDSTAGRPESKLYAYENGRRSVEEHWKRLGIPAEVTHDSHYGHYRSSLAVTGSPLVSILIPNRNQAKLLKRAVDSILLKTAYRNYEILILENNSTDREIFELYDEYAKLPNVRILTRNREFNFSEINNFGASEANGEYLVLLNNDIEVTDGSWLSEMLGYCQREDVGAVGLLLKYPGGMIQHAGVVLGLGGPAGHIFGGMDPKDYPGGGRALSTQNVSAVTAACLMTKKCLYEEVEGLDAGFKVAFGDIDYCLKLRNMGYLIVQNANAEMLHHESATRGPEDDPLKKERFLQESGLLRAKWKSAYPNGDPYYNPNLTLSRPDYSLRT